jgi:hypothetical protein
VAGGFALMFAVQYLLDWRPDTAALIVWTPYAAGLVWYSERRRKKRRTR